MLLHDACHSIDSAKVGAILENIKFPYYPKAARSEVLLSWQRDSSIGRAP
jgi:hypothetical protein